MKPDNSSSVYINFISLLLIFIVFVNLSIFPQVNNNDIIAEVGSDKITASEFIELYELSPHLAKDNSSSYIGKVKFLNTIIAYKLWFRNIQYLKVDTSWAYRTAVNEITKMFVRDALYGKEILGKIVITDQEFSDAKAKQQRTLDVNYILSQDEAEINDLLVLLDAGYPFDSLLSIRDEAEYQREPVKIKFGDYNEPSENQLYALNPGEYSSVIRFRDGYYIFRLNGISAGFGQEGADEKTSDIIKKRKENILYDKFMKRILNGAKADVNKSLIEKLEKELTEEFNTSKQEAGKDSLITLTLDQYIVVEKSFTEKELSSSFITFAGETISLKTFMRGLFFNGIKIPSADPLIVKNIFNTYVKDYITKEIIYTEGKKQGLESSDEVRKYVKMWSEYYALETAKGSMIDTLQITSGEIEDAYKEHYKNKLTGNMTFEEAKPVFSSRIAATKINKTLTEMTAGFASGTAIKIYYDVLEKIETTDINSLVMRNLGFGGTINAVPLYTPNYEWINSARSTPPTP